MFVSCDPLEIDAIEPKVFLTKILLSFFFHRSHDLITHKQITRHNDSHVQIETDETAHSNGDQLKKKITWYYREKNSFRNENRITDVTQSIY